MFLLLTESHSHQGTKRFDSEKAGDREVQRTMLELLNQLDGFSSHHDIKVARFIIHCVLFNCFGILKLDLFL